jgi:hypothetical protein
LMTPLTQIISGLLPRSSKKWSNRTVRCYATFPVSSSMKRSRSESARPLTTDSTRSRHWLQNQTGTPSESILRVVPCVAVSPQTIQVEGCSSSLILQPVDRIDDLLDLLSLVRVRCSVQSLLHLVPEQVRPVLDYHGHGTPGAVLGWRILMSNHRRKLLEWEQG